MAKHAMPNYLRRERRAWGLTQRELAELLGCRCITQISRIEHDRRPPSLCVLVACKVLFGKPTRRIFPQLYEEIEDFVMRQAYGLYQRLEADQGPGALRKKEFLDQVLKRAIKRNHSNKPNAKDNVS